jgi:GT2 family glycosyltransferase
MPELVRHGISGFFIERDLEDLSSKLRLLRDNSDLRSSMARQIHKDVQSWGWSISAEPYRQMLKHMLKQPEIVAAESEVKSEEGAIDNAPAMGLPLMSAEEVKGAVMMLAKSNLLLLPQTFIAEHQRVEVTVVILSYGRVELTLNALRSLLDNSSLRFKLLLIDNGSSEEVKNRLTEFCAEHDFIELIFLDQNLGCAGGRMFALDRVSTKYVMFIDNDIEIFPGTLEHLLYALESNPQLHAAAAKVILPDGLVHLCGGDYMSKDDVLSYELLGSGLRFDDPAIGGSGLCKWINGGATMFRKAAFLSQPFDLAMQGYYEDLEWCYRLNQIGEGLFHRSVEALALHYHRPPTLADAASSEDKRQQSVKYIEAIAHFYRIHGRIVQNIFDFVPELRPPSDQLVISAARMFLELVNSVGTDWLMERWNGNRLDPLFAATRLSTESAQLVEAQGRVMELTDRLAISKAKFSAKTVEDGKTIESLTESLAKSNANFNARTVEDGKTIESLRDRLARSEQLVRVLVTERRETRKSLEHLLEEMSLKEAEKQKIIDEKQETIDQKQKLIEEKQKLIEEKQTSIEELSLLASALEAEIQRLKSTLGWRLLNVYGRIKYRYLLPVYRMGRSKNPEEGLDEESKDDKESLAG